MGNSFNPHIYQVSKFPELSINAFSELSNNYVFLGKPTKRNIFKLSLAQMLHYFIDFGIGYQSVCVTALHTPQHFDLGRYVNRHGSISDNRPATIADFKEKVLNVVKEMVRHTVNYYSPGSGNPLVEVNGGMRVINNVYPSHIFTLDTDRKLAQKLEELTGYEYVERSFTDFAYLSSSEQHTMPNFKNGLIPIEKMLYCPEHSHTIGSMTVKFGYSGRSKPEGKEPAQSHTSWKGRITGDKSICAGSGKQVVQFGSEDNTCASHTFDVSWGQPTGITCYPAKSQEPAGAITVNGERVISVRYPGRRYRLFVRTGEGSGSGGSDSTQRKIINVYKGESQTITFADYLPVSSIAEEKCIVVPDTTILPNFVKTETYVSFTVPDNIEEFTIQCTYTYAGIDKTTDLVIKIHDAPTPEPDPTPSDTDEDADEDIDPMDDPSIWNNVSTTTMDIIKGVAYEFDLTDYNYIGGSVRTDFHATVGTGVSLTNLYIQNGKLRFAIASNNTSTQIELKIIIPSSNTGGYAYAKYLLNIQDS